MGETYNVKLKCKNCLLRKKFAILKGKTVEEFTNETSCPNCGNKTLKKSFIQFI